MLIQHFVSPRGNTSLNHFARTLSLVRSNVKAMEAFKVPSSPRTRHSSVLLPPTVDSPCFVIDAKNRSYKHQYSNIYFIRLAMLKQPVLERANARWKDLDGNPVYVPRVLDVVKSQLCWILGTVYMDMPLKPNVLEDLGRDHSLPPPQFREKIYSDQDCVMLEDESGRIKLVGRKLNSTHVVTGVIIAALGMETPGGEFEVIDTCFADLAPFAEQHAAGNNSMDVDSTAQPDEYLAVVSGLSVGTESQPDPQIQMLVEYLSGEVGGHDDQAIASQITRLIIAGNSLLPVADIENGTEEEEKKPKKPSTMTPSDLSPHPNSVLSAYLHDLASTLPVHIVPGSDDPSGAILPQQPFPRAMFSGATDFESFHCETNPVWLRLRGGADAEELSSDVSSVGNPPVTRSILVTSGQPVLDMFKYLPTPPFTLVSIAELTLKWRHIAPTAPDTLWCHPYRERDPFVLNETPDIYVIGGMSEFATTLVGPEQEDEGKKSRKCRVVLLPNFAETGTLVLINMRTLDVRCVNFGVKGLSAGGRQAELLEEDPMQEG